MTTDALSARILSGQAPAALKLAAARGALPLPPGELLRVQVTLRDDADPEVSAAARASLARIPRPLVETLREDPATPPEIVAYLLAERIDLPSSLRAGLVAHPSASGALLERVARAETQAEVVDALLANHRRLLAEPAVVAALRGNPSLSPDQCRRLADLSEHLLRTTPARPGAAALPAEAAPQDAAAPVAPEALVPARDPRLAAAGVDAEVEALLPLLDIDVGELLSRSEIQGGEEFAADADHAGAYERILHLTVGQKLRLALFGTREERTILVRDTNRLIATCVVKNPRITEDELEQISHSRNVCEEVLLAVSRRRDAAKRYAIAHNLVRNPRTPIGVSVGLVPKLYDRDLKLLAGDRNVSELVRVHARRQVAARAARQRSTSFKKGH